jgi:hypothetical protein
MGRYRIGNGAWTEDDRFRHRGVVRGSPSVKSDEYRHNSELAVGAPVRPGAGLSLVPRTATRAPAERGVATSAGPLGFPGRVLAFPLHLHFRRLRPGPPPKLQFDPDLSSCIPKWRQHEPGLGGSTGGDRAHSAGCPVCSDSGSVLFHGRSGQRLCCPALVSLGHSGPIPSKPLARFRFQESSSRECGLA